MRNIVTLFASAAAIAPVQAAETWGQALREGDAIFDLRARYESVEQVLGDEDEFVHGAPSGGVGVGWRWPEGCPPPAAGGAV